ncbi:MAG: hypothetical protein OHK0011_26160 [Turneriella sp.]
MARSRRYLPLVVTGLAGAVVATAPINLAGNWQLKEATTTYEVQHPLKTARGISRSAKGRVRCDKRSCEALLAVEVKSFDSGDSNRDLHMLETVRGALHPVLTVRSRFAPRLTAGGQLTVDLEIELAGQKSTVRGVSLQTELLTNRSLKVTGGFVIQLSAFGVERPSLLGMAIKDTVPITFESVWER